MTASETGKLEPIRINVLALKTTFHANGIGRIGAHVGIEGESDTDQEALDRMNVHGLSLDTVTEYHEAQLYPMSLHEIELDTETGKIKFVSVRQYSDQVDDPQRCPHCNGSLYSVKEIGLWCHNAVCPSRSRGCLHLLVEPYLIGVHNESRVEGMLDWYHLNGAHAPIDNLFEFKRLFCDQKFPRRTELRKQQWLDHSKRRGEEYFEIETAFETAISRKTLSPFHFWTACNFPFLDETFSKQVPRAFLSLSPRDVLSGDASVKEALAQLKPKERELIENNHDFLKLLLEVFDSRGEVEWI